MLCWQRAGEHLGAQFHREVANESHRIEYFGKKTLSTVRGRCGFGSGLSLDELLGLGHLLNALVWWSLHHPPFHRAVQTLE